MNDKTIVVIQEKKQVIEVEVPNKTQVIEVGLLGLQGPKGDKGDSPEIRNITSEDINKLFF